MDRLPELEAMYAQMNQAGRDYLCSIARQMQKRFPAAPARSHLFLVQNADDVQALDNSSNCGVNRQFVLGAGEAVNGK
jgi:hypothetical protein